MGDIAVLAEHRPCLYHAAGLKPDNGADGVAVGLGSFQPNAGPVTAAGQVIADLGTEILLVGQRSVVTLIEPGDPHRDQLAEPS